MMRALIVSVLLLCALAGCARLRGPAPEEAPSDVPPPINLTTLEQHIHTLVNQVRGRNGLPQLAWHDRLAAVARLHSADMAEHRFFEHVNRQGEDAQARLERAGVECRPNAARTDRRGLGENLFATYRYRSVTSRTGPHGTRFVFDWKSEQDLAQEIVEGWMDSSGHRANLLSTLFEAEGIGVALADNNMLYITQNLCR